MNEYNAYVHAKKDGTVFYVGKSVNKKRMNNFNNRSIWHKRVVEKQGGKDQILVGHLECSSEKIALDLEIGLIKCFRRMNFELVNLTDGGEGTTGSKRTEESRALIAKRSSEVSEETRQKRAVALKGRDIPQSQREQIRETLAKTRAEKIASGEIVVLSPEEKKEIRNRKLRERYENDPEYRARVNQYNRSKSERANERRRERYASDEAYKEKIKQKQIEDRDKINARVRAKDKTALNAKRRERYAAKQAAQNRA